MTAAAIYRTLIMLVETPESLARRPFPADVRPRRSHGFRLQLRRIRARPDQRSGRHHDATAYSGAKGEHHQTRGIVASKSESILALFAPAATPQPVVEYLNAKVVDSLSDPATRARLLEDGLEAAGTPPAALVALMKSEMERLGGIIKHTATVA